METKNSADVESGLIEEAKKYKSFDDFTNSLGKEGKVIYMNPKDLYIFQDTRVQNSSIPDGDITSSILSQGFRGDSPVSLIIGRDGSMQLADGNGRVTSSIGLGIDKIPVRVTYNSFYNIDKFSEYFGRRDENNININDIFRQNDILSVYNKRNIKRDSIQSHYESLKKDLSDGAKEMNPEDVVSLEYYKFFGYENINKDLRGGEFKNKGHEYISDNLKRIIEEKGSSEGTFYRGVYASPELASEFKNISVGDTFTDKGFMSTSTSKKVANEFADGVISQYDDGTPFIFHIKGKGLDLSKIFKSTERESEILLNAGNKYTVTNIDGNNIYLTQQ